MKKFLLVLGLFLGGCSKGPHVASSQECGAYKVKYRCDYSNSVWQTNRTIAICDTQEECNKICATLIQK